MKKIITYISVFFMIGTLITLSMLTYIDNFIYSLSNSSVITAALPSSQNQVEIKPSTNVVVPDNAQDIQYSFDNKYYTYLLDNEIYINNIEDGKNVSKIKDSSTICYYKLLYDKNLIIYFTQDKTGTTSKLKLKTYEFSNERTSEYNSFTITNFSKIKDIDFSPIINIIYINVETKSGTTASDTLYRIDLFNSMSKLTSGIVAEKIVMLQHKDKLYYEDKKGNIYSSGSLLSIFKEKVDLIGIDLDDNIYFLSKNDKDVVYKVYNNKIVDKIELSDTDVVKTYSNNEAVYLIYPNYVINVSGEDPYKRLGRLSNYVKFDAIKDNMMYLRTSNNTMIKVELVK